MILRDEYVCMNEVQVNEVWCCEGAIMSHVVLDFTLAVFNITIFSFIYSHVGTFHSEY